MLLKLAVRWGRGWCVLVPSCDLCGRIRQRQSLKLYSPIDTGGTRGSAVTRGNKAGRSRSVSVCYCPPPLPPLIFYFLQRLLSLYQKLICRKQSSFCLPPPTLSSWKYLHSHAYIKNQGTHWQLNRVRKERDFEFDYNTSRFYALRTP